MRLSPHEQLMARGFVSARQRHSPETVSGPMPYGDRERGITGTEVRRPDVPEPHPAVRCGELARSDAGAGKVGRVLTQLAPTHNGERITWVAA